MQRAERAYSSNNAPIKSASQIEYEAFARISRQLKLTNQNRKTEYSAFVKALHENRNLWRILAIDVADRGNSLTESLRAQIFYLAEFTDAHTRRVLADDVSIEPLTDINLAVMRGLSMKEPLS
ncbi:MAG: flagellar biosynthesis regulator FlaF [Litoreibacter sp.]